VVSAADHRTIYVSDLIFASFIINLRWYHFKFTSALIRVKEMINPSYHMSRT
jgi:hypothetical protein